MINNTDVMLDEILSHRIGLIPIDLEPSYLEFPDHPIDDQSNDRTNVILFGLPAKGGEGTTTYEGEIDSTMENFLPALYVGNS
jgi:DNA-directed RNA polymerase I and III subunit RPAC1